MSKCDDLKRMPKEICQFMENKFEPEVTKWLDAYAKLNKDDDGKREIADEVKKLDECLHSYFFDLRIEPKTLLMLVKGMLGDLENLVKKSDLGVEKESVDLKKLAEKSDLKNLVKKEDLGVEKESVDLKELAKKNDLDDLTKEVKGIKDATDKIKDIKTETDKIKDLAKTTDLPDISNLAKKDDIPDLSNLAQKNDLKELAKTADLQGLAKKSDLGDLTRKVEGIKDETDKIKDLVKKEDLGIKDDEKLDLKNLVEKDDLKELAKKNDLDELNQRVADFAHQDQAFDQAITKEIKTISQGVNVIPQEVKVEFVRGNEVAGRYEAEIKLEGNKIGTFSSVGHYFFDNRIYIYDHFNPQVSIDLPPQYHFLKVIRTEEDGYKLAFCNEGGQEYYKIPSDYKLISPENLKSIKNIDFEKYYAKNGSSPSFVVKMNSASYSNSSQHGVDVYEIGNGGKKIGSLIDEFGYYDSQNKFHYFNNHINAQDHSYDSPAFTINRGDIECSSHEMQVKARDIDLASDTAACSLVEYVANYVNDVYF
ncbi:hypothetical protein [Candidatus Mesenet endosymbiont of Agriotes lineatus]|uniref:hypothetical protein n=1 Tax=Candidatus Mesenet endosymbiont of Agriotes lineatus TaxID=3077948 RepID=UPI0030CA6094